ncbi:MAG: class I SAM-dependent methyltransferase [Deinococcales bacterium]
MLPALSPGLVTWAPSTKGELILVPDPLDVGRTKPYAKRVRWIHGTAAALPAVRADLVTMTGNVAQVFVTDEEWMSALAASWVGLNPGGRLVFETRDPAKRAWEHWNREDTLALLESPGRGRVESWTEILNFDLPLVSFRHTFVFESDGTVLTSDSTLRFRRASEISASLSAAGFLVEDIRDAPDRPGKELVFVARRPE